MPIPKIIHFTLPARPTDRQLEAIKIAKQMHSAWQVLVWQDPLPPEDFRLSKYWHQTQSGAQLADLIRLDVVLMHGGIYLDSDVMLQKPLDALTEKHDFIVASEDGRILTNAVFGAIAHHPALQKLVDELDSNPPNWSMPCNITTGPGLFSRILKWRKDITVLPRATFYPYNWNEKPSSPHPHTYGTHLWEASWVPNHGKPTTAQWLIRHLNPIKKISRLIQKCEKKVKSNERALKLISGKTPAYPASERLVRKTIHGHSIILCGNDLSVAPEIIQNGYYELREELFLQKTLRGGDYFIDVGANAGVFSLLAASLVGPFGRVFAYEPNPSMADMLRASAAMNWVHDRLHVSTSAVGENPGASTLIFNPYRAGDASLVANESQGSSARTIDFLGESQTVEAKIVSLDMEFPTNVPIKFLKVDAEGYEVSVLRGADRLLQSHCIDYVMLEAVEEVSGDAWTDLLKAIATLCSYGYTPHTFGRNGIPLATNLDAVRNGSGLLTRNLLLASPFALNPARRTFAKTAQVKFTT